MKGIRMPLDYQSAGTLEEDDPFVPGFVLKQLLASALLCVACTMVVSSLPRYSTPPLAVYQIFLTVVLSGSEVFLLWATVKRLAWQRYFWFEITGVCTSMVVCSCIYAIAAVWVWAMPDGIR